MNTDIKAIKKELAKMAKDLEKQWKDEVDGADRKKPSDYIKTSHIQGQLDMVVRILSIMP